MIHLLAKWVVNALALLLVAYVIPGITVESFTTALILAIVLGLLNILLRPILLLLTLPINLLTLGLFTLIVNGFLFWLAARWIDGFGVSSFFVAVLGAFVFSIIHGLGEKLFLREDTAEK